MQLATDRIFIINPITDEPVPGLYAIKLGRRDCLDRAFALFQVTVSREQEPKWYCHFDGQEIGASVDFKVALGRFAKHNYLIGRKIEHDEYSRLVFLRLKDVASGLDIDAPIDLNNVRLENMS